MKPNTCENTWPFDYRKSEGMKVFPFFKCCGWFLLVSFLLVHVSCQDTPMGSQVTTATPRSARTLFTSYTDSLISIKAINAALGTDYSVIDLGRPIGVSGTSFWLVTVGGWHLNNRNILLQGTAFKESSSFYPNPARKTEVEFEGPFTGLIRYDESSGQYSWLIQPGNLISEFKYQGTEDHDLIVLNETDNRLEFLDIGTQLGFSIKDESAKILDWSLDKSTNAVVVLMKGSNSEVETNIFPIDSMLRISITTNGNE